MSAAELNPADVQVDVVLQSLGGFAAIASKGVRLTHIPTGIVVVEDKARSAHANRHAAWERLAKLVAAAEAQAQHDRHAMQADGKHPAPCARFCEATAFGVELRQATARVTAAERLLSKALNALKYHQEQTRPIHYTTETIAAIEAHFGGGGATGKTP